MGLSAGDGSRRILVVMTIDLVWLYISRKVLLMTEMRCPSCGANCEFEGEVVGGSATCSSCGAAIEVAGEQRDQKQEQQQEESPPTVSSGVGVVSDGPVSTSGMAVSALVLAILGMCLPLVGLVGLILGIVAINRIDNPANRLTGRGLALSGAIVGGISMVLSMIMIPLGIGIMLPALAAARSSAQRMQNMTQVRGIQSSMVMYSQGNNDYYPGMDGKGVIVDDTVAGRYQMLLDLNYFLGKNAIAPVDSTKTVWVTGDTASKANYSYSMLDISRTGARRGEWRNTVNFEAAVISDRNTGLDADVNVQSIWTEGPGWWKGSISWNDGHALFETSQTVSTVYAGKGHTVDNLFVDEARGDDAFMVDD